jgi:hypothetical protein
MFQTLGKSFNGESSTGIGLNLVKTMERNDVSIKLLIIDAAGLCDFKYLEMQVINITILNLI